MFQVLSPCTFKFQLETCSCCFLKKYVLWLYILFLNLRRKDIPRTHRNPLSSQLIYSSTYKILFQSLVFCKHLFHHFRQLFKRGNKRYFFFHLSKSICRINKRKSRFLGCIKITLCIPYIHNLV